MLRPTARKQLWFWGRALPIVRCKGQDIQRVCSCPACFVPTSHADSKARLGQPWTLLSYGPPASFLGDAWVRNSLEESRFQSRWRSPLATLLTVSHKPVSCLSCWNLQVRGASPSAVGQRTQSSYNEVTLLGVQGQGMRRTVARKSQIREARNPDVPRAHRTG